MQKKIFVPSVASKNHLTVLEEAAAQSAIIAGAFKIQEALTNNNGLWEKPNERELARAQADTSDIRYNLGDNPLVLRIPAKASQLHINIEAALQDSGALNRTAGIFNAVGLDLADPYVIIANEAGRKTIQDYIRNRNNSVSLS